MVKNDLATEKATSRRKNALIEEVNAARNKWKKFAETKSIRVYEMERDFDRSPMKYIYMVPASPRWNAIKSEINNLETKIKRAGFIGRKKPRSLWMPTILEDASDITIKKYQAKSNRRVSLDTAKSFAAREGLSNSRISNNQKLKGKKKRSIDTYTGYRYKLHVLTKSDETYYSDFTEWVVCICSSRKRPQITEKTPCYRPRSNTKKTICSSKDQNRALVVEV